MRARLTLLCILFIACGVYIGLAFRSAIAQTPSASTPWSPPVNLSLSGAASQPVIGVGRNGVVFAMWWDAIDGERYARGVITGTQTTWGRSALAPVIFGDRMQDTTTRRVALSPPDRLSITVDGAGVPSAIWFARNNRLLYSQLQGRAWTAGQALSENAIAANASVDVTGTLRMAYIQSASSQQSPSGVYYATRTGAQLRRTLVFSSTYFRTASAADANVSVTANRNGVILVAWNQVRDGQSLYSRSTDAGRTWSQPQQIVPRSPELGAASLVSAANVPNGDLLLVWRDTSAPGCGFTQRRSSDGGETWSAPERILPALQRCPDQWTFSVSDDGKLWMLGLPKSSTPLRDTDGMLAEYDGQRWSESVVLQFAYVEADAQRTRGLGCLNASLAGSNIALIGCDVRDDAWASQNAVSLDSIIPALKSPWSPTTDLSRGISGQLANGGTRDLALAADTSGQLYAVWGQTEQRGMPAAAMFLSAFVNDQWSDATRVLSKPGEGGANEQAVVKFEQPSLAVDNEDRLHLVWSGGSTGQIYYSSAFGRDAGLSEGWSTPTPLPTSGAVNASPVVVADPRGQLLYVIYAVPFNEGRGIYLTQSNDSGTTWQAPITVFDAAAAGWNSADAPRLALDASANAMHAVWLRSSVPGSTEPRELYYARSVAGQPWTAPAKITGGLVDMPRIAAAGNGTVMIIWNALRDPGADATPSFDTWFQVSPDGGQEWASAARVPGFEQLTGGASLVASGPDQMYLTGISRGPGGTGQLLFSQWNGREWSAFESSALAQLADSNSYPVAALSGSGQLGAVLRMQQLQEDGASVDVPVGISRGVAAAELQPLPTFTPRPTATAVPTSTPAPTATPPAAIPTAAPVGTAGAGQGPNSIVIAGVLALVVIIVGAVLAFTLLRRR